MVINWDINSKAHPMAELQKYFSDFKRFRPYYYSDYYPLTNKENMTSDNVWLAYQLNRPDKGDGIVMAFRRKNCPDESVSVNLKGIDPGADYELLDEDTGKKVIQKGEVLRNGIILSLSEQQKSLLISYKRVN
jgi:alpha-galactosidase